MLKKRPSGLLTCSRSIPGIFLQRRCSHSFPPCSLCTILPSAATQKHGVTRRCLSVGFFFFFCSGNKPVLPRRKGVVMKEMEGNLIKAVLMMVALNDRWRVSVVDRMIWLTQRRQQKQLLLCTYLDQSDSEVAASLHPCHSKLTEWNKFQLETIRIAKLESLHVVLSCSSNWMFSFDPHHHGQASSFFFFF